MHVQIQKKLTKDWLNMGISIKLLTRLCASSNITIFPCSSTPWVRLDWKNEWIGIIKHASDSEFAKTERDIKDFWACSITSLWIPPKISLPFSCEYVWTLHYKINVLKNDLWIQKIIIWHKYDVCIRLDLSCQVVWAHSVGNKKELKKCILNLRSYNSDIIILGF